MKSGKINFLSIQSGENRTYTSIKKGFDTVINIYKKRGFKIANIHGDNEFDMQKLREHLRPATLHIHGKNKHVGVIERSIRSVKDRCRSVCHSLPFRRYTKLMTNSLVEYVVYWMNSFPARDGSSERISPAGIVLGRPSPNAKYRMIAFGAYAMVYTNTQNNMKAQAIPAIALKPSNHWGGYYFMSLFSGKRIHAYDWVEAPINNEITARVHELAREEKQPLLVDRYPIFEWSIGKPIEDNDPLDITEISDEDNNDTLIPIVVCHEHNNATALDEGETPGAEEELIPDEQEGGEKSDLFDKPIDEDTGTQELAEEHSDVLFESLNNAIVEAEKQLESEIREINELQHNNLNTSAMSEETVEEVNQDEICEENERDENTMLDEEEATGNEESQVSNTGRPVRRRQEPTRLFMDPSSKAYSSFKHRTMLQRKIRRRELERCNRSVAIKLLSRKIG